MKPLWALNPALGMATLQSNLNANFSINDITCDVKRKFIYLSKIDFTYYEPGEGE